MRHALLGLLYAVLTLMDWTYGFYRKVRYMMRKLWMGLALFLAGCASGPRIPWSTLAEVRKDVVEADDRECDGERPVVLAALERDEQGWLLVVDSATGKALLLHYPTVEGVAPDVYAHLPINWEEETVGRAHWKTYPTKDGKAVSPCGLLFP